MLLPRGLDLSAYEAIFSGGVVTRALGVSVFVTVVGTGLSRLVSCLLDHASSRRHFVLGRPVLLVVLIGMLFSPGIIPVYLVVKQTGLLNSLWALIIPTMVSGFKVLVLRSFFQGIPDSLTESATIDGASEWTIFSRIVMPLSKAVLAVIGLFYAVGYWNSFFTALLYIDDATKWPMQLVLRTYVVNDAAMGQADVEFSRAAAVSTDGGESFESERFAYQSDLLTTPEVQGSIVNASQYEDEAGDRLVYAAPQHGRLRKDLGLFLSEDGGATWTHRADLTRNRSGYSDLVMLDDERVGVLYETGLASGDARNTIVFQVAEI